MCLTPIVEYAPRPVREAQRPDGAPPSLAENDSNLYGPKPTPPAWQASDGHTDEGHTHSSSGVDATAAATVVATAVAGLEPVGSRLASTIIELPSGRRLLITEL